jgi:hypothetical protein
MTEDECLQRYDDVARLVTAADGAVDFIQPGETTDDSGNTVIRRETFEQAIALDQIMWDVWNLHPPHVKICNVGSFQNKLEATTQAVSKLVRRET